MQKITEKELRVKLREHSVEEIRKVDNYLRIDFGSRVIFITHEELEDALDCIIGKRIINRIVKKGEA